MRPYLRARCAAIEGAINAAINALEHDISTPITVSIEFQSMSGGLGESTTTVYATDYLDYYNALKANATSAAQLTALNVVGFSLNPVPESSSVALMAAGGLAQVGYRLQRLRSSRGRAA